MWTMEELSYEAFVTRYRVEDIIVLYEDNIPICTCVLQWSDVDFWPEVSDWTSGFLHKIAIRRWYAGGTYIRKLLDFILLECQRRNISTLRIDVDSSRPHLCKYYESLGFSYIDTVKRLEFMVKRYAMYF